MPNSTWVWEAMPNGPRPLPSQTPRRHGLDFVTTGSACSTKYRRIA
jgi:hypothetical protein